MAGEEPHPLEQRRRVDRERIVRSLTFWLRPDFVLRVVGRFQKLAGFDRSIALASGALTAKPCRTSLAPRACDANLVPAAALLSGPVGTFSQFVELRGAPKGCFCGVFAAPPVGLEPTTCGLEVRHMQAISAS